jgi:hypothetical protein
MIIIISPFECSVEGFDEVFFVCCCEECCAGEAEGTGEGGEGLGEGLFVGGFVNVPELAEIGKDVGGVEMEADGEECWEFGEEGVEEGGEGEEWSRFIVGISI